MDIQNKIAIVTGASNGIGLAIAQELTKRGATVVLAARSADKLAEIGKQLPNSLVVPTDMRNHDQVKNLIDKAVEKFGRIDILVNNAGQGLYAPIEKVDIAGFRDIIELNVIAPLVAMEAVIPIMRKQGGGAILNISSRVSKNAYPGLGAYAATKYALNGLSFTARNELAGDNIIVGTFHPKMTATDFGKNSVGARPDWAANPAANMPRPDIDTAEQVATKVADLIVSGAAEAEM